MKLRFNGKFLVILTVVMLSCSEDFLDEKSSASIQSPSKIEDYQALLDDAAGMMNSTPPILLSFIGGEEYRVTSAAWHAVPVTNNRVQQKNAYIWKKDVYEGEAGSDWNNAYAKILYANIALEGVEGIVPEEKEIIAWNNVKGSALFYRAWNLYLLSQEFAKVYDPATAKVDLGVPLRLQSDVTVVSKRGTVQDTYLRIIEDLKDAVNLLPDKSSAKTRPSRAAALVLLAKAYMDMEEYQNALEVLYEIGLLQEQLLDYKQLSSTAAYPFSADYGASNPEVLFLCYMNTPGIMATTRMNVNADLLNFYKEGDLRSQLFYTKHAQGNIYFRGSYLGSSQLFLGLCMPEALLIKAECLARGGQLDEAALELKALDVLRYNNVESVPVRSFQSTEDAVRTIIEERRKELAFRGNRWADLRRFNKESAFEIKVTRQIDDDIYDLKPQSSNFVWQIPDEVISLSGIEQNE